MQKSKNCKNRKRNTTQITTIFLMKSQRNKNENICNLFLNFLTIKFQIHLAPQNDCQNLRFVEDIYVAGKKMTRNTLFPSGNYSFWIWKSKGHST